MQQERAKALDNHLMWERGESQGSIGLRGESQDSIGLSSLTGVSSAVLRQSLAGAMTCHGVGRAVCFLGPPAAGKGTQCERIVEKYGLAHISPGEILRGHVRRKTDIGMRAKIFMDQGLLVPSDIVIEAIKERLGERDVHDFGCILDNFPLTAEQAEAMEGQFEADQLILVEVPDNQLMQRARSRVLDPQTGIIYNLEDDAPPPEVVPRLERRSDDSDESIRKRLETYHRHVDAIQPFFQNKTYRIDGTCTRDEVFACISSCLESLDWVQACSDPYKGHMAFDGRFSDEDAERAGFFSASKPPECGDAVISFMRRGNWQKIGIVTQVEEDVISDGSIEGLEAGHESTLITVRTESGREFRTWAVFLAPLDDVDQYSALCTTAEFQRSHFCQLYTCTYGVADADPVPKSKARESLLLWLQGLLDSDGESIEVPREIQEKLVQGFDEHAEGSLWLYSTDSKLVRRSSRSAGADYSKYYRALNNTLNNDYLPGLRAAMPLIQRMMYLLLYDEETKQKRLHPGCRAWKGDIQKPGPLKARKLREAAELGTVVRFRQFQSTTLDEALAKKYMKREDGRGYLWIIDIPAGFWGARDIHDVSDKTKEAEILFPPYAAFRVKKVRADSCHLEAMPKDVELKLKALRHGLSGTAVELLGY